MVAAASRLKCEVKDLHIHFNGDARTFRRWKENADKNPNEKSTIKYSAFGLLTAIVHNEIIFTEDKKPLDVANAELWKLVADNYVYKAGEFTPPNEKIVKMFYGKDSITGLYRLELASLLGYDKSHFGRLIVKMNFGTWASLMLCLGVPVSQMFDIQ
ncbi:hypothetical protein [Enterovibrio norvegicus]|uniref:Uncharacterized protein n=1 Tax=Enterovibrio norvegicus TaxID=188144 RepID=A0ABV4L558_9GAMM